jgi:protein-disulfide isomerase
MKILCAILFVGLASQANAAEERPCTDASDGIVASADGISVTESQMKAAVANKLLRVRSDQYTLERLALLQLIDEKLLAREASKRGVTVQDLLLAEVQGKVTDPPDSELRAAFETVNGRPLEAGNLDAVRARVYQQKLGQRREEYLASLRKLASVRIQLDAPRIPVEPGSGPTIGTSSAIVTAVVFEDFECPYCAQMTRSLKELQRSFPSQLRIVHRDFPLPNHPHAIDAAVAGRCAKDKGLFWEAHEQLFSNQVRLNRADLLRYGQALGLDAASFEECLDSDTHRNAVYADREYGSSIGVVSTPTIFLNGRFILGSKPVEYLQEVLEEELASCQRATALKQE